MFRQNIKQKKDKKIKQARQTYIQIGTQKNKWGSYKILWNGYHEGEPLLTIGPDYIVFLIAFLIINIFSIWLILRLKDNERAKPFYLLQIVLLIFLDIVWLATTLIFPGIALQEQDKTSQIDICVECLQHNGTNINKKLQRQHCQQCNVCLQQKLMHFKLIGGCVGKDNFIAFKLLILGIFLWGLGTLTIIPQLLTI